MDPRHLELAAEFGQITGKRDLLEYLELGPGATSEDAKAALRARRRKLQGMQANPKFRREATFLIKQSGALEAVLEDVEAYRSAIRDAHEQAQVPILELAIQGALSGGPLSAQQRVHVRDMARKLGISDPTFEATLARLAGSPQPVSESVETARATVDSPSTLDSDFALRPGLASAPTAPPVRARAHRPGAPPPVPPLARHGQTLGMDAMQAPALEIIGAPIRYVRLGGEAVVHEIRVRHRSRATTPTRVSADAGWLIVSPKVLDPARREQTVSVHVDPTAIVDPPQSAVVHIVSDDGSRASIVFETLPPEPSKPGWWFWTFLAIGLIAVVIVVALLTRSALAGEVPLHVSPPAGWLR